MNNILIIFISLNLFLLLACNNSIEDAENSLTDTDLTVEVSHQEKELPKFAPYKYPMKNIEIKEYVKETVYKFTLNPIDPPIPVSLEKIRDVIIIDGGFTLDAQNFFRAQALGNVDEYLDFLGPELRAEAEAEIGDTEEGKEKFGEKLKANIKDKKIYLNAQIDRLVPNRGYVYMVNYQIVSKDGKIVEKNLFFGKNDKDSLNKIIPKVDDIVFNNWDFEGDEKIIKIDNDYD